VNQTISKLKFLAGKVSILLLSFLGALFCLLNARGADLLCLTQGCRIYSSYTLLGIGFYIYGLAGFLLIFALALIYPRARSALWLSLVVGTILLLDGFFLVYQYLFWPCMSCLVVAALIGMIAVAGIWWLRLPGRPLLMLIGAAWFVFFGYATLEASKEISFPSWAIAGEADAPIKVFFSPVCPACKDVVTRILQDPGTARMTAFYPIAKNSRDEERIAAWLEAAETRGEAPPLTDLFEDPETVANLTAADRGRLRANKITLARRGGASVPFIVAPFLPELSKPVQSIFTPPSGDLFAPPGASPFGSASPFAPPVQGCGFIEDVDCEESRPR
jgi:hypothetical protein